ncbi:NAD(P)-dependent oxidoreductase [Sinomonas cyclohexanicum]|uniref:NAD(P)-dependent oxidoreductase n=1 Tax=Sinomonas cyclohexanicum TaxID=322009 RepID=UPI001E3B9657|nr:NAD(P)-dependent oxidoreductase [Corynebacterium cyclohexanicum]
MSWDGPHDAEILWRREGDPTAELLAAAARGTAVRWVHLDTVGVDRLPLAAWRERSIRVSNGRGLSTVQVAEWATAAMLLAVRRLHETVRLSDLRRWEPPTEPTGTVHGRRVVILGMGAIGARVAYLAGVLGATVTGIISSNPAPHDPRHGLVDALLPAERFREACRDAELLVLCAPLTETTRSIVSAEVISELMGSAWIVNAARGGLVDEAALAEAVRSGRLGGAVLDVTSPEPPRADSPLWGQPNIILSSHVADRPRAPNEESGRLFLAEFERYLRRERMHNEVDLTRGY